MLHQTCVLSFGGIYGSRNAFRCIRGKNNDALFFMLGWARCGFDKKRATTCYTELVFSHLVGSAGHVVRSGASDEQNIDTLFFMLVWDQYRYKKSAMRHVTLSMCFYIPWDLHVM
jgi:hypothetical protein